MNKWKELSTELGELLQLDSRAIAVKRMEQKDGLMDIPGIEKPKTAFTYCQLPYLVRKEGKTIGITKDDATPLAEKMQLRYRCLRVQGLALLMSSRLKTKQKGLTVSGLTAMKPQKRPWGHTTMHPPLKL